MTATHHALRSSEPSRLHRLPARQLVVLGLLCGVSPFATDMYLPAFTSMQADLSTSASLVQLTLTTFLVGFAFGQLIIGPVSDRFGRRRPLLMATAVFAIANAVCALAPGVWVFVGARFLAGFAGSAGLVIGRAIVSDRVSGPRAARSLSVLLMISSVAPVVAPLVGGALVDPIGWRGIFWVLTGLAVVMFFGALLLLPESLQARHRSTEGVGAAIATGRGLLRDRQFSANVAVYALGFGAMMAYVSASPFVVQNVYGLSAREYSYDFAANASMLTVSFAANAYFVPRVGAHRMRAIGVGGLFLSTLIFAVLTFSGHTPLAAMLVLLAINVGSLGLTSSNSTALAMARAPHAAGTGSALIGAIQFGFGSVMSPLVGLGGSGTAVPMAIVMLGCSSGALGASRFARLPTGESDLKALHDPEYVDEASVPSPML
ncbi:DHA1 family bicyclomycin/chloramphenicol resistance-like MFS transporter [Jatrophihabitans sp. GAS493]|uniref:multidrug effflux MFS transporter n=1 Tax=Jatrophihabitans sp. GAS493 TaxID=1907575 RepID=UPI000BB6F188|nr:multidrug effflux MFS transporter [Jatrophihabitans sp. GAS493]SOD72832.1 DHA1 family bicyclomycin/chloramphenicol resistance-like MFS transporter [Jatrophihabitans sp. GAS493]